MMSKKKSDKLHKKFTKMIKRSLREFNEHEARGWTIDRFQQIEYRVNEKIIEFFKPEKKEDFKKFMLNTSIMDMGSKLKVLSNIGTVHQKTIEKIRRLAAIRNGFAHATIRGLITINITTDKNGRNETADVNEESVIEVMNSNGKIIAKNALDYLTEFWELNNEIREEI